MCVPSSAHKTIPSHLSCRERALCPCSTLREINLENATIESRAFLFPPYQDTSQEETDSVHFYLPTVCIFCTHALSELERLILPFSLCTALRVCIRTKAHCQAQEVLAPLVQSAEQCTCICAHALPETDRLILFIFAEHSTVCTHSHTSRAQSPISFHRVTCFCVGSTRSSALLALACVQG